MESKITNGFSVAKLSGLTWNEIEGYAAELSRNDGNVTYRAKYLCTVYNDADGGDILDADGETMTDTQVQSAIDDIDNES